jgi:hypothetical protein
MEDDLDVEIERLSFLFPLSDTIIKLELGL